MNDWFRKYPFKDYHSAIAHLDKRSKRVRDDAPLAHAVRLVRHFVDDSSVSVVYHRTPIVTFWANGTQALHWGGWYTKTTFEHIQRYAQLGDLVLGTHNRSRNGHGDGAVWHLDRSDWPRTPSRVTRCRACKGAGHRGDPTLRYVDGELTESARCWRCEGHGEIERGLKVVPEILEGDAVLTLRPGKLGAPQVVAVEDGLGEVLPTYACSCSLCRCGCGNWVSHWSHTISAHEYKYAGPLYTYSPPTSTSTPHDMGSEVADELAELLPGLASKVQCPRCTAETVTRPVRDMIVHLNDRHRVSREEIADWLDALDVDLRFPTPAFS